MHSTNSNLFRVVRQWQLHWGGVGTIIGQRDGLQAHVKLVRVIHDSRRRDYDVLATIYVRDKRNRLKRVCAASGRTIDLALDQAYERAQKKLATADLALDQNLVTPAEPESETRSDSGVASS